MGNIDEITNGGNKNYFFATARRFNCQNGD